MKGHKSKCQFRMPSFHREIWKRYTALKMVSVLLGAYIAIWSFTPVDTFGILGGFVSETGYIIDTASEERTEDGVILTRGSYRPIVAANELQMVCLGVTRVSAFFMYPSLVLVFTTKFRATMEVIMQSPLSMFTYDDLHELHVYCGWIVVFDGILHTLFHMIRWADQGNMNLVFDTTYHTRSGISGFVCVICIMLIGFPMMFEAFRKRVPYEVRKGLHYFFVVFCIAMAFHAPLSTIPNGGFAAIIFPTLIMWYVLDAMYVYLFLTEKIDTTTFHVVKTGVQLTMTVSENFQRRGECGGYCYINFPWISRYEWHAYSLFENPANPNERQIYIQDLGDWTHALHSALERDTRRPVWVQGPFSSPYDNATESDNQILVAGGIGITPAISVMRKHKDSRRTNLIWAVRDPHMLEFFVKHGEFSSRGWNLIFYTGKEPLYIGNSSEIMTKTGAMVHIIRARPNLQELIPNIIYSIECDDKTVPEAFILTKTKMDAIAALKDRLGELDGIASMSSREKMTALINYSDELGFLFTELMSNIANGDGEVADHLKTIQRNPDKQVQKRKVSFKREGEANDGDTDDEEEEEEEDMLAQIRDTVTDQYPEEVYDSFRARHDNIRAHAEKLLVQANRTVYNRQSVADEEIELLRGSSEGRSTFDRTTIDRGTSVGGQAWTAFGTTMGNWMEEEASIFVPWKEDGTEATSFVKDLDQSRVLSTWGALYCGGQGPLADALKKTTKELGIKAAMESFKW